MPLDPFNPAHITAQPAGINLHAGPLNLIVADVIMPGMKGTEVFKEIHPNHPEAAVLYMSGYTDNVFSREQLVENAAHFIRKPFTANGLLEKVGSMLRNSAY